MAEYTSESDFKYIRGLDEMPEIGPDLDQFTEEDKFDAAEVGEAKLEADINNGFEIQEPEELHRKAAGVYASFWLFIEAEEPSSALSGQIIEGSSDDAAEFVSRIENTYWNLVQSIRDSDADEGPDEQTFEFFST